MRKARWIAIVAGLAIVVAALVGWRGSRPTSPTATTRGDGVAVVPATGTLRREDAVPPADAPLPLPSATAPTPSVFGGKSYGIEDIDAVAAAFEAQPRDPSWAPGAEAGLRTAFAALPDLDGSVQVACGTGLCRLVARVPGGLDPDRADRAVAMLQARSSAQMRLDRPFGGSLSSSDRDEETGATVHTVWFTRR